MSNEKTRILCISLGSIGKRHLRNMRELLPEAEIAVYRQHTPADGSVPEGADLSLSNMEEVLSFAPHAAYISSPASEHVGNAMALLKQNVPMCIEKPLAATSEGTEDFLNAAKDSGAFVMVGYILRFLPALHRIRALLESGELGTVRTARVEVGQYLPDWRPDSDYRKGVSAQKKLGGGALLELSHEIDYATWLFGFPTSLQCTKAQVSGLEMDVEDSAHILMEYEDKVVSLQLDFLQRVANMAVQIVTDKGTFYADLIKETARFITPENPEGEAIDMNPLPNGNDIYLRQCDFFLSRALPDYTPRYEQSASFADYASLENSAHVLRLVDAAKLASEQGARQPFSSEA